MARQLNNIVMRGTSGQIGRQVVFRADPATGGHSRILAAMPTASGLKPTLKQALQRANWAVAAAWAKLNRNDAAIEQTQTSKQASAVSHWFANEPKIDSITLDIAADGDTVTLNGSTASAGHEVRMGYYSANGDMLNSVDPGDQFLLSDAGDDAVGARFNLIADPDGANEATVYSVDVPFDSFR